MCDPLEVHSGYLPRKFEWNSTREFPVISRQSLKFGRHPWPYRLRWSVLSPQFCRTGQSLAWIKILWRYDVISIFGEFPKFRKIPWGVNGEPLTGNIGDRNDFIFGTLWRLDGRCNSRARTPIFCLNFFLANFQNDQNSCDFAFFFIVWFPYLTDDF